MSYMTNLAQLNWSEWRMLPTEDAREPIQKTKYKLNVTFEELNQLVNAVETLAKREEELNPIENLQTIAEKCWYYIREQKDPINAKFFHRESLLLKCNRIYRSYSTQTRELTPIICQDGIIEISKAEFKILQRESPIISSLQAVNIAKFGINTKTLENLLAHLSNDRLKASDLPFVEYLNLLTAVSLLEINHFQRLCLSNYSALLKCTPFQIRVALESKIKQLKSIDENIFERKLLLDSFQNLIQFILSKDISYLKLAHLLPLKALKLSPCSYTRGSLYDNFLPSLSDSAYLTSLEKLKLFHWNISKENLNKLGLLKNLREITFSFCCFTQDALELLPSFFKLETLKILCPLKKENMEADFLSESTFKMIGKISNLKHVHFMRGGNIEDEWLQHINALKLETLKINRISHFAGNGLRYLNPENLKSLELETCWDLSQEGVRQILRFTQLKSLTLSIHPGNSRENKDVDEEFLKILPNLSVKELKISHRGHISPLSIYAYLRPEVEVINHNVEGITKFVGSRIAFLKRVMQLKKWNAQGLYFSPQFIEKILHQAPVKEHIAYLWEKGITALDNAFNL